MEPAPDASPAAPAPKVVSVPDSWEERTAPVAVVEPSAPADVPVAAASPVVASADPVRTEFPVEPVESDPEVENCTKQELAFDATMEKMIGNLADAAELFDLVDQWVDLDDHTVTYKGRSLAFCHHHMVTEKPFLNKAWLLNCANEFGLVKATGTLNLSLLHDPDHSDEAPFPVAACAAFWKSISSKLGRTFSALGAFSEYPLLKVLLDSVESDSRQSLVDSLLPNKERMFYFDQALKCANEVGAQAANLAFINFYFGLIDLHSAILSLEIRLEHENGAFNLFSCRFGSAVRYDFVDKKCETKYTCIEGPAGETKLAVIRELTRLGVKNPDVKSIHGNKTGKIWYFIKSMPTSFSRKRSFQLDVVYGETVDHIVPVETELFESHLPDGMIIAVDKAKAAWEDKEKMVLWAVYSAVFMFLALFVWRCWNSYRKARARNFWKKLMSNEAQVKHQKSANGVITLIYIVGAIFSIFTLWADGLKNIGTVSGAFTSVAGLFTKSAKGAFSFFEPEEAEDADESDDEEEPKKKPKRKPKSAADCQNDDDGYSEKKRRVKINVKTKNSAQELLKPIEEWDGAYLSDMLETLSASAFAVNKAQVEDVKIVLNGTPISVSTVNRTPHCFRVKDSDTWQVIYKTPMALLFKVWSWFCAIGAILLGASLFIKLVFLCIVCVILVPIVTIILWKLQSGIRAWWRNRRSQNSAQIAVKRDWTIHKLLADGELLMKEYHAGKRIPVTWLTRYASYIQAKMKLGLPLSAEETSYTKILDIGDLVYIGRNQKAAGMKDAPRPRNSPEARARGKKKRVQYDNGDDIDHDDHHDDPLDWADLMHGAPDLDDIMEQFEERRNIEREKFDDALAKEMEERSRRKHNPRSKHPHEEHKPNGIVKDVKVEGSLVTLEVMKKLNALHNRLASRGQRGFPTPNWEDCLVHYKAYPSYMNSFMQWCKKHNTIVDRVDCPFCPEKTVDCILPHGSIRSIPREEKSHTSEAFTNESPRKIDFAVLAASAAILRVERKGEKGIANAFVSDSGIITNQHAVDGADSIEIEVSGLPPVKISPDAFKQCSRKGVPVDVAVCKDIPARLNCPRVAIRPVTNPGHWLQVSMLHTRYNDNGKFKNPTYNVAPGHFAGFDAKCPPSVSRGRSYPCGKASATYASEDGDSGSMIVDSLANVFGIHCSGHATGGGQGNHNHFELLYGLDLEKVKQPLNC